MSKSKISENDLNFKQISKESLSQQDSSRVRKEKILRAYYTNLATLGGQLKDWKDCTQLTNQEMNALSEHEKVQFKIISQCQNKIKTKFKYLSNFDKSKSVISSVYDDLMNEQNYEPEVDHVQENIQMAPKAKQISQIKNIYSNIVKDENQEFVKDFKTKQEEAYVDQTKNHLEKWYKFKEKKH